MCAPPVLAAVAAGMAAIGTGIGAISAANQARYQAKIAERNAGLEREAARQEIANTKEAALAQYRKIGDLKGQQRLAAAANGVAIDFGTMADVQADTDMLAREDVSRIYRQGNENLRTHDIGASNYKAEANAKRSQASGALIKGVFDFGSTVLGGAQQYEELRLKAKPR